MTPRLDRDDIQGNVLLPYGRKTFAMGSLLLFHLKRVLPQAASGGQAMSPGQASARARRFLQELLPQISTGRLYRSKRTGSRAAVASPPLPQAPPVAVNVAFTCAGLAAFGVPQTTLAGLPVEFQEGMRVRAALFHDDIGRWDPVWIERDGEARIDLLIVLRANVGRALARVYRLHGIPEPQQPPAAGYHRRAIFEQARALARGRLAHRRQQLIRRAEAMGLTLLAGHGPATDPDARERRWQDFETLTCTRAEEAPAADRDEPQPTEEGEDLRYSEIEHFGFFDGIGDPVFQGQYPPEQEAEALIGQGKLIQGHWHPLATGEFLLGYPDEAQELPTAAVPLTFSRNGTFLVVRKLHQHVARFERAITAQLPAFQSWLRQGRSPVGGPAAPAGEDDPDEARQLLRAKLVGRWEDGTPLVEAPSHREWLAFKAGFQRLQAEAESDEAARRELTLWRRRLRDVRYEPLDRDGDRCPLTAHIRRSNPRDSGDPRLGEQPREEERRQASSVLANRRRILRRGMPYGERWHPDPEAPDPLAACVDDGRERGTLFMALCSGLFRQFEFLQQQWLNHGSEFGAGNDVCPISGVMAPRDRSQGTKLIIGTAADSDRPPFVVRPSEAVECRGGAYFFVPSLTALRQIAQGMVDPA